jgi:hypothetical protein
MKKARKMKPVNALGWCVVRRENNMILGDVHDTRGAARRFVEMRAEPRSWRIARVRITEVKSRSTT